MSSAKSFPIRSQVSQTKQTRIKKKSTSLDKSPRKKNRALLNPYPVKNKQTLEKINHKNKVNQIKSEPLKSSKVENIRLKKHPLWLKALMSFHFISSITTFILVGSALGVYGWTVYTQQSWGKSYRYLESLQRNERELITTNETIKNNFAIEAEKPEMGLVDPNVNTTIFLNPAPDQLNISESSSDEGKQKALEGVLYNSTPLGY